MRVFLGKKGICGGLLFITQFDLDAPVPACKGVIQERCNRTDNQRHDTKNDREDNDRQQAQDFDTGYGSLKSD
jgi:hypothetical protein